VGALPLAVTNCLNFANPQRPEIMAQIVHALEGMSEACRALDFPIVSGNVSLYNESKATGGGSAILPTPAIGGVGLMEDWTKAVGIGFTGDESAWAEDNIESARIILVGTPGGHLGQSLWLREIHGREDGPPPPVDLASERKAGEFVRACVEQGKVIAAHDVSDGGIAVALAEMALAGNRGAFIFGGPHWDTGAAALFAEDQGLYLVTTTERAEDFIALAQQAGVAAQLLGRVGEDPRLIFDLPAGDLIVSLADLRAAHEGFFPNLMSGASKAA